VNGQCVLITCDQTQTRCGSTCSDLQTDPNHCGICERSCVGGTGADAVCSGGQCGLHCSADPQDQQCAPPNHCSQSHCCASDQTWCGDRCVATATDASNCGGCGLPCSAPNHGVPVCSNSQCSYSCQGGYSPCGSGCIDSSSDVNNCGSCSHRCTSGSCLGGACLIASVSCSIAANSSWQTCGGANVQAGDHLEIQASGNWTTSPTYDPSGTGPTGRSTDPVLLDYRYDTAFYYGALLWGVSGGGDQPFTSGSVSASAPSSGDLYFRINDEDSALGNNTGSMNVSIQVSRP
jgi:hypothetical protein